MGCVWKSISIFPPSKAAATPRAEDVIRQSRILQSALHFSSEKRSQMMSGIRCKNTKPELTLRRHLHAAGLRFRLHDP
ncbi:hypothetical protein [Rhizobium azibense]|uniref:hypothetical protein n=1 Tax=Rhizobium azibense TaxID=1136135 RepID=UPI003CCB219E